MSKDDRELIEGEALARRFHETYERLAPSFGYETRADTKAFDPATPNGRLMIAVCSELVATRLEALQAQPVGEGAFVAGPVWSDDECWTSEIQIVGGYYVVATVHGGSEAEVIARRDTCLAALTASPPVVEREAIARIIDPEAFLTLREIAAEKGLDAANPPPGVVLLDPIDGPRNAFRDRHDAALAKADDILALTPVEGVGERALRDAVVDLLAIVKGDLSGPAQVSGVISEAEAILAALSTPVAQGDEVRDALEAVRDFLLNHRDNAMARMSTLAIVDATLATLTKGARDAR